MRKLLYTIPVLVGLFLAPNAKAQQPIYDPPLCPASTTVLAQTSAPTGHLKAYLCVDALGNIQSPVLGGGTLGSAWNNSYPYQIGAIVSYMGNGYTAILANKNTVPSNATFWTEFGSGGGGSGQGYPFPGPAPETDNNNATACPPGAANNGTTDDSTANNGCINAAAAAGGGLVVIGNNSLWTPGMLNTPTNGWMTLGLAGKTTIAGTLTLPPLIALGCVNPQLFAPNSNFEDRPSCSILFNGGFSPAIQQTDRSYFHDINLGGSYTGIGISVTGTDNHFYNVSSQTLGDGIPLSMGNTFGFHDIFGKYSVTTGSTKPSIFRNAGGIDSYYETFLNGHGILYDSTVNPCVGPNAGDVVSYGMLEENALHDALGSMFIVDLSGCNQVNFMHVLPNMADNASPTTPLINIIGGTGSNRASDFIIDDPDIQGPIFQTLPGNNTQVVGADVNGCANRSMVIGLTGPNSFYRFYCRGGETFSAGGGIGRATVGGDIVGMIPPTSSAPTPGGGGSLSAGTYWYYLVGLDSLGNETVPSAEQEVTVSASGSAAFTVTVSPGSVATRAYRGTAQGQEGVYYQFTGASFTDTGATPTGTQSPTQMSPNPGTMAATSKRNANGGEFSGLTGCTALGYQGCPSSTTPGDLQIKGTLTGPTGGTFLVQSGPGQNIEVAGNSGGSVTLAGGTVNSGSLQDDNAARVLQFGTLIEEATHTPSSSTAACTTGQIAWDASFLYVCKATNSWVRTALVTF